MFIVSAPNVINIPRKVKTGVSCEGHVTSGSERWARVKIQRNIYTETPLRLNRINFGNKSEVNLKNGEEVHCPQGTNVGHNARVYAIP
jgi:hypothetical protein